MGAFVILIIVMALLIYAFMPKYKGPKVHKGFVTHEECDHIMEVSKPRLSNSTIGVNKNADNTIRISQTAWLDYEDKIVRDVSERCASLYDKTLVECESLQTLKYEPGGFYSPHQDVLPLKNPRRHTCIIALNDGYMGGETNFPNLNKKFKLEKGDVLCFDTLNGIGRITDQALHGGLPIEEGEKWIANLWIHKYPYSITE